MCLGLSIRPEQRCQRRIRFIPFIVYYKVYNSAAGPRSAIGRAPDSQVRGPGFDSWSSNIRSFLFPLSQEGQLSVTGESMCTK